MPRRIAPDAGDRRHGLRCSIPVLLCLALIASVTLGRAEIDPVGAYPLDPLCLICGDRGSADAVLNVLLFVPLGIAAVRCWGWRAVVLLGVAVSAGIESAQASIPGRFPTVADVVWNGMGTGLGVALERLRAALPSLAPSRRLALAATVLTLPLLPALAFAPSPTTNEYFAQWAPSVSSGRSYDGRVVAADLDGIDVRSGRLSSSEDVRAALRRGAPLRVSFVVTNPPDRFSHLFRFVDSRANEIAALGVREQDLVWVERTASAALAFRAPTLVWARALEGGVPGLTVTAVVRKEKGSVCMQLDARERCGLIPHLRDGWQTLVPDLDLVATRGRALAGVLWLGIPGLLAGLLVQGRPRDAAAAAGGAIIAAGLLAALPGVALSAADVAVTIAAVATGAALALLLRRVSGRRRTLST